jgi:hypothetical protein
MSNSSATRPLSLWSGVFKACILLAVGVRIFTHVAPIHPAAAFFASVLLLGSVFYLLAAILTAITR